MEKIGGYRLVRKLGEGERAEVWLGHGGEPGVGALVAVKLFKAHVTQRSIDDEIEALARASSAHLVELLDIGTAADGRPCLVLNRLSNGSLDQLFARRHSFSAGELVTALAPVTAALAELHRLGIAHGSVRASAVLLDDRRAPVLACFGAARVIGDPPIDSSTSSLTMVERSNSEEILADQAKVISLVRSFAGRLADPHAYSSLVEWLEKTPAGDSTLFELTDRLYDGADAQPLHMADRDERPATFARVRVNRTPAETMVTLAHAPTLEGPASLSAVAVGLVGWVTSHTNGAWLAERAARLRTALKSVRRPVWIIAGGGLVALVLAIGVIPAVGSASPSAATTPFPTQSGSAVISARGALEPALTSDDPVAAARALVTARGRCIDARSVGCLESVDQAGSVALESDRYFLRQLQGGSTVKDRALDASVVTLIQRLGDTALIGLGQPTAPSVYPGSLLIVKVGAGWRIRDLTTGITP